MNLRFENDVKTYSIQTAEIQLLYYCLFENDVKTYSIQTFFLLVPGFIPFENDVKTYSIQTICTGHSRKDCLRMM